jgi:[CysO sulfur-carrier protein]-S-L-cysteine hydrolase
MKIARNLLDQIIDHARRDAPNECCGVVSIDGADARGVFPLKNLAASPLRFEVGPDLVGVMEDIDDAGHELGAIYHSHTRTPPRPSQTDVNFAVNWPGVEWLIVGVDGDEVDVRSYLIDGGQVQEVPVEVE